jgi:acetoin utilization protein AcuC
MKPTRLKLTYELMRETKLLEDPSIMVSEPRTAQRDELLLFHNEEYLKLVERMSKVGSGFLDMGDTPAFKGCYESSALATGATLTAIDLVMSGKATHAMNIAGGLHHAHAGRASGFCIFNDPAVGIAYLKRKYAIERVLYLDVDAHHGDGVMYGFYADDGVLNIDFHEDGHHLFPGTGFIHETGEGRASGFKINVPLPPFTGDEMYLRLFREIVPAAVRRFRPQFLLCQFGVDSHANDLLAHLQITSKTYLEIAKTVHDLAHEVAGGRLVVVGGGGYNVGNVARIWALAAATLVDLNIPQPIPQNWQKMFEAVIGEKAPSIISSEHEAAESLSGRIPGNYATEILRELRKRLPLLAT